MVAAYGLAGIQDSQEAIKTLAKALSEERDPVVRDSLSALQSFLTEDQRKKMKEWPL
jgi:hypothetical protein